MVDALLGSRGSGPRVKRKKLTLGWLLWCSAPRWLKTRFTMSSAPDAAALPKLFLPSKRASAVLAVLALAALGAALYLRYAIIQNSAIGVACEAGEQSLTCEVRLAVI